MQQYPLAMLSANVEYDNEHVTVFDSCKGQQVIPEQYWHLFKDELTDEQLIFPLPKANI
jgi:hypothetical protein